VDDSFRTEELETLFLEFVDRALLPSRAKFIVEIEPINSKILLFQTLAKPQDFVKEFL